MKKLITAREVEDLLKNGGSPDSIPADALLTPSARDILKDAARQFVVGANPVVTPQMPASRKPSSEPFVPDYEYSWKPGKDPKTPTEIERFFHSPEITVLKQRIVDIGRRIWEKDYVDGNGGNITIRVGDNLVLCTPTLISKGFMQAHELCLVDMNGVQVAGERKRTSEVNTHIGIMKRQPAAKSCVHAHPPHATAYAVAGVVPPTCMIPEAEVFLGQIGYAPYRTPGTPENADIVGEVGINHQSVIMENHGVITWGKDVEDAYWKMENTDAYCKTVWIASQLGTGLKTISGSQLKDLLKIRQSLGMPDNRLDLKECELCQNDEFRPGVTCHVPSAKPAPADQSDVAEAAVQQITDMIMKQLNS
jgi:L-fuculose-phosphate aldolase